MFGWDIMPRIMSGGIWRSVYLVEKKATNDIYIVADVLGHKDINTTKKHYAAVSEDIRIKAADMVKL